MRMTRLALALLLVALSPPAFTVTLSGKVLDSAKNPAGGVSVWVAQDRQVRKTVTGGDGSFSFEGLQVARTELVALREGSPLAGRSGLLAVDESVELVFKDNPGTIKIRVTDGNFNPLPGAKVRAMVVCDEFAVSVEDLAREGFPQMRANDSGEIDVAGIPADGFAKLVVGHLKYADSNVAYLPVREKRQDVQLYEGVAVRGRVTLEGKPVSSARVSIFQSGLEGQKKFADVLTDPEGFYAVRIAPGGYLAVAGHPDHASPEPVSIDVSGTETVTDLVLLTPRLISGSVVLPDGKPCPGVRVGFRAKTAIFDETLTDGNGRFAMKAGYADGELLISPPPGFRTASLPRIPVSMGEAMTAELQPVRLLELPVIKGRVTLEDGEKPGRVLVESTDLPQPIRLLTDADGAFLLRFDYQPDQNTVTFRAEHALRFLRKEFKVNLDTAPDLAVQLEPFEVDLSKRPPIMGRNDLSSMIGKPAPAFQCSDWFNTQPLDLAALKGKVVVMTLWGGFDDSPFAMNRLGELRALHDLYQGVDDVVVLGIHDASSEPDEIADYLKRLDVRFPVGRDADPFVTFSNYKTTFIPQTVLIDREGTLRQDQIEGRLLEMIKALRRK